MKDIGLSIHLLGKFYNLSKEYMYVEQVDVGDFLRLKSCILYTELENPDQPLINVEVVAHVTRPEIRSSEVKPCLLHY